MATLISSHEQTHDTASSADRLSHLSEVIDHAAHLLPMQGPITSFVHHNTLHAFEDLPFLEAVKKGGHIFGCQPFLSEERYRHELNRGRIRFDELQLVLEQDLAESAGQPVPPFGTRLDLRRAMLQYPLQSGPTEELIWYVAEVNGLHRVRSEVSFALRARLIAETRRWVSRDLRSAVDSSNGYGNGRSRRGTERNGVPASLTELLNRFDESRMESWTEEDWEGFTLQALWRVCCDGVRGLPPYTAPPAMPVRHRDLLWDTAGADADAPVHDLLIRFCAAFLDQGVAAWQLPERGKGFYQSFCALYGEPNGPPDRWMRGLSAEIARLEAEKIGPLASISESLAILGVPEAEWEAYLSATFLALRGWGGMVRQIEVRGDRVVHPAPAGSLVEFLAIRLMLDRHALAFTARETIGYTGPLSELRDVLRPRLQVSWPPSDEQRAFAVFQLAQVLGASPDVLYRLSRDAWSTLMREIELFTGVERRRVFHLAYERRFYAQTLDAVSLHALAPSREPARPRFQAVFCIDEREESIRRHLEEVAPDASTFATAGFYSVAMYFRGAADAHFVPLCPPVVVPQHWVAETVCESHAGAFERRARARRALGLLSHQVHKGSRSFAVGALLSTGLGVLASVPLVARTLFPRLTWRVRAQLDRMVETPGETRLQLERDEPTPGPDAGRLGFSIDEMTAIGEKVLRELGLTDTFARLVLLFGHGSSSQNNPHKAAYDCGACGGARGGPNARALARILNEERVRAGLAARGIVIPPDTVFVGGMHNTGNDSVVFYDLDLLPETHRADLSVATADLDRACARNSHERSRRFQSAPLTLSFASAREGVEARTEDLAQVRPEWGHMTNAICIVGRRSFTRGLFLDRRAFLTSYDPTKDDAEGTVLARILGAVFPVCAGISLEYYFSAVDNQGFGCGSKLPHNITSLLGVMDGAASDLRTGLPLQMIEYHEPVRILFIIESTTQLMLRMINRNQVVGRLCRNGWVRLAVIHPETREVSVYQDGEFQPYSVEASVLPRASSSVDWYRGWRDHLEFAEIEN